MASFFASSFRNRNGFRGVLVSVNFINFGVRGGEQLLNFRIFFPFSWITAQDVTKQIKTEERIFN